MSSTRFVHSRGFLCRGLVSAIGLLALAACAGAQAPYDPPTTYYDTATGTGVTLRNNLHLIMSKDFWNAASTTQRFRSYGNARDALQILDQDPTDNTKIVLIYTANSVNRTWDAGATWNREHTWPRSRGVDSSGPDNTDLHMLRPCNPSVNSSRSNLPFGIGGGYWDPLAKILVAGANHRGEIARTQFYAAVRYDGVDGFTTNLTLVNGQPSGTQMGDLARLLEWHYSDPIDEQERRRNHLVFDNTDNPFWYQGNRNPFVDRPEFVWAIWGTSDNDSVVFVGNSAGAGGESTTDLDLQAIEGAALLEGDVLVSKLGSTPTTYDLIPGIGLTVDGAPSGRAFPAGAQGSTVTIRADGPFTPGITFTALTIDNTDLTSAGAGMGADDADDVVNVSIDVLSHAVASFDGVSLMTTDLVQTEATENAQAITIDVPIHNLGGGAGQAALDVDGVSGLPARFTAVAPLPALITDQPQTLSISFDQAGLSAGAIVQETATIDLSDEDLPGGVSSQLTLNLEIEIVPVPVGCPGDANRDGVVDFGDINAVLGAWLTMPLEGQPGDANGDGIVDFDDLTGVLGNWGDVCQ